MKEAVLLYWPSEVEGLTLPQLDDHQAMAAVFRALTSAAPAGHGADYGGRRGGKRSGELLALFFELVAEEHLIQPTFIVDYPLEFRRSPSRRRQSNFVERFELYIGGMEIANAFSELNDPRSSATASNTNRTARKR